ncbi:MAG: hypothetical protein ACTSP9_14340 [Promethearchaeota archaeon]
MNIVKIGTIICVLILVSIPIAGARSCNICYGSVYGEVEDCTVSRIAYLRHLITGKPVLLITRGEIIIKQDPNEISLRLFNPINKYCVGYEGNITIHFYASLVFFNFDAYNNPNSNITYIVCNGIFGHMDIERR